ncbi:DUF3343 domain-containing protein [Clostridium formicaceticum]|uniref:Putative Se/S carrier protein-like domain-containing protein n=1 Tax=Clostridium formicaceticum TaxID=1497 RepID=A0AAC9RGS9_9CLOT|nr:hypothetical protein BJL90_10475 [Clostridium formicaceticum]ARE86676.1 hypothetical protein CLFO_10020 [Clostridium formicaceticum]
MKNFYCVLTFHNTHHALNTEKVLKEKNIPVKLMPVPRQVSSSCGIAAEFSCKDKEVVLTLCKKHHIEIDEVHKIEKQEKGTWFTKLMRTN